MAMDVLNVPTLEFPEAANVSACVLVVASVSVLVVNVTGFPLVALMTREFPERLAVKFGLELIWVTTLFRMSLAMVVYENVLVPSEIERTLPVFRTVAEPIPVPVC